MSLPPGVVQGSIQGSQEEANARARRITIVTLARDLFVESCKASMEVNKSVMDYEIRPMAEGCFKAATAFVEVCEENS